MTLQVVLDAALVLALVLVGVWGWQQRQHLLRLTREQAQPKPAEPPVPPVLLHSIGMTLADGLLIFHADRRVWFTNQALSQILDLPAERMLGQTLIAVLRDYHADAAIERALATGERQTIVFQPTLSQRRLVLTCQPLLAPLDGGVLVLRDLTQLAHLERARRELVANVSHELRTPLASIRLLVETLASDPPPHVAQRMLGQIDDETQAMTQLVDELRELSQIESGRLALQVQPAQLSDIVERSVERLRAQAGRRGLQITSEIAPNLPLALIDGERIGQVMLNLLHNAIKFTPEQGTITVRVQPVTPPPSERVAHELGMIEGHNWLLVAVSDTGIGIPSAEIDRVFERFFKVDRARTRNSGGTGLGLAIAKHLIERHGGRIWAESREGRGSTFSLLLPIA